MKLRLPTYEETETILTGALIIIPIILGLLFGWLVPTEYGLGGLVWWCVSGIIFLTFLVVEIYILLGGD